MCKVFFFQQLFYYYIIYYSQGDTNSQKPNSLLDIKADSDSEVETNIEKYEQMREIFTF